MLLQNIYQPALLQTPEKAAIILNESICTYNQLDVKINEYAIKLFSLGIEPGNAVGLLSENNLELIYLYFACFKLGAIAVPTSFYSSQNEIEYEFEHSKVSFVFVSKAKYPVLEQLHHTNPRFKNLMTIEDFEKMEIKIDDSKLPKVSQSDQDPAIVLYTSGSTGKTKGVTHTHFSLYQGALSRCSTLLQNEHSVFLTSSYLCHGAAPSIGLFPALLSGGTTVFMRKYSPEIFIDLIERYSVTHAVSSPSQWDEVINLPKNLPSTFRSLKYASAGGDKVPVELQNKFKEKTGVDLAISLGMTECGVSLTTRPNQLIKPGSLGTLCDGFEIKLLDEEGREVIDGEVGEFVIKSKSCAIGYWDNEENTKRFFRDGWYYSGDLGRKDQDGYYYFEGRSKNMIIRGGGNIAPAEIEDVIILHEKVRQCCICGVPDIKQGETVFAFIVPESGEELPSTEELVEFLTGKISDRKIPEYWHFTNQLLMNSEGSKINRKDMKEMAVQIVDQLKRSV
jgi:long-chain acyl-CoA synthetase